MKLYFSPGACSLAPHIVTRELSLPISLVKVDLKTKTLEDGTEFGRINPKESVPAIELDTGEILTENTVVLRYLATLKPDRKMAFSEGEKDYYHFLEWLNYTATE